MFDEMHGEAGEVRPMFQVIENWLRTAASEVLSAKRQEAERLFRRIGITFAVYTEGGDPERLIPFDIIPRVIGQTNGSNWKRACASA